MARPKKQDAPGSSTEAENASTPANAAADAFAKIEPELAKLTPEEVVAVTVDIPAAVAVVTAAVPRIREYRDAVVEQLPMHPIAHIDELQTYAHAAWYAHLAHTYASSGPEAAKGLVDEATKLRDGLLIAAEALAHRGLLDGDAVAKMRKGGSPDIAADLGTLASLFKSSWSRVSAKTAVERHEVDRAAELGPAVMVAVAIRKHGSKPMDTADQRARAFTVLSNVYDSVRRALAYLRWTEGDADAIAPSILQKKRGRKPGAEKKAESTEPEGGEAAGTEGAAEA